MQFGDDLTVRPAFEVEVDALLQRAVVEFGESRHEVAVQGVGGHVGQRGPVPQAQRLAQQRAPSRVVAVAGGALGRRQRAAEAQQVQLGVVGGQEVAAGDGADRLRRPVPARKQCAAQSHDVGPHSDVGTFGRVLAPQVPDQFVRGDRLVGVQQHRRQKDPQLRGGYEHFPSLAPHTQRAE
ncbi:hypothetical protein QFZ63_002704 [Streptomyces sp. B3I7]|nr:hypothetical protein [Streptomyces sp. B3I7]MDQ0810990.1 hypothetical protein [Streptomyces sp. B3I7]